MTWRIIKDYPMYMVSDTGLIKSLYKNIILSPGITRKGYKRARLFNGKSRSIFVHRLVADAFMTNPNNLPQINHKDCNKLNNNVGNLEWCTGGYNQKHAYDNGLKVQYKGEKHSCAKLTDADVMFIREIYSGGGVTYKDIAKYWGVCTSTVGYIITKQNWAHL